MNVDEKLEMETVQGRAPEEPDMKLNSQERTNEGDTNEILDTAQAKEKIVVPMVSNILHVSTGELEVLQQGSDPSKFSENTIHRKLGDSPKSSAKTIQLKQGNISKTTAKTTNPKQANISKTTGHPIQTKHSNIPKSLAKNAHPKQENIYKSPANTIHHKEASMPKSSEDTVQAKENDTSEFSEDTNQYKVGNTRKPSKDTKRSKKGDTHRSSKDTTKSQEEEITKPQEGEITKSPEDTTQSQEGNVIKSSEATIQPMEGNLPKSSKEIIQPKKSNTSQPEEKTESLELDMVKVITGKEDFEKMLKEAGERLVAVDFSATWCSPCRIIKPIFHSLSLKHEDVVFLEVDADTCEELVQDCNVFCLPTFQFYKKEEKVGEFSGAVVEKLVSSIEELK
ncbi:thioredoxin domain-containing protein 2 isoform X1 [Nannospalax galili]|uniref:thioredoxin domain-containing protein 2 isoform X1 n=1 Tax=Nannospalax galili TaxID=1026970 RepID=UPI00111C7BAE|nr:thioredoxin domain-containing protein 2 isoform X1 [Nannospalax galili]